MSTKPQEKPQAKPHDGTWIKLVRWRLVGEKNGGSRQWVRVVRAILADVPQVTTNVHASSTDEGTR